MTRCEESLTGPAGPCGLRSVLTGFALLTATALAVLALGASTARAAQPFALGPGIFPHAAVDGAGTAHVAWRDLTNVFYCRVPRGATACAAKLKLTPSDSPSEVDEPYVLLGNGKVYVVMPRFVDDVQLWTSSNGGVSFPTGVQVGSGEATGATTGVPILDASGSGIYVPSASGIDGLAILQRVDVSGSTDTEGYAGLPLENVNTVAVGRDGSKPVLIADDGQTVSTFRYDGTGPLDVEANWIGPNPVGPGRVVTAANGPAGLFVQHYAPEGRYVVRRFAGTVFGAPMAVSGLGTLDPAPPTVDPFLSNLSQNSSGRLDAVWLDHGEALRHGVSTNGGASFATSTLLLGIPGARYSVSTAPDGYGLVTWYDGDTVFGSRLDPLPPPQPPKPPVVTMPRPTPKVVILRRSRRFGRTLVTLKLRLPAAGCLPQRGRLPVNLVAKNVKQKNGKPYRGKTYTIKKALFRLNRVKVVDRKKPFSAHVRLEGLRKGSRRVVSAHVFLKPGEGKREIKLITGMVPVCR